MKNIKKEYKYLGFGLILSLYSLKGAGGFIIPWEIQLAFGLTLMIYGTYLLLQNSGKEKVLKYALPVWSVFIIAGIMSLSNSPENNSILNSDLESATNYEGIKTCEEGEEKAKRDLKNGKLRYIFGGFGSRQPLAENLKKLGIEVIKLDGVVGMPNKCYNDIMYEEIQKKFGNDIFNREYK